MSEKVIRLFRLTRDTAQLEQYNAVGEANLTTSIRTEAGTLGMYSTHLPEDLAVNYVFEVYRDEDAYAVHAASPQFKAYVAMAGQALTGREVIPLREELLLEKPEPLRVTGENAVETRLALLTVPAEGAEAFRAAVFENMRTSIQKEPGVLTMYGCTRRDDPTKWVFWEVYASAAAYAAHRETDHFKAYIARTADCVTEKTLVVLASDVLVNQGGAGAPI